MPLEDSMTVNSQNTDSSTTPRSLKILEVRAKQQQLNNIKKGQISDILRFVGTLFLIASSFIVSKSPNFNEMAKMLAVLTITSSGFAGGANLILFTERVFRKAEINIDIKKAISKYAISDEELKSVVTTRDTREGNHR